MPLVKTQLVQFNEPVDFAPTSSHLQIEPTVAFTFSQQTKQFLGHVMVEELEWIAKLQMLKNLSDVLES